jgi:hypothetical protein
MYLEKMHLPFASLLVVIIFCGCSAVKEYHEQSRVRPLQAPDGTLMPKVGGGLLGPEQAQKLRWAPKKPSFLSQSDYDGLLYTISRLPGLKSYYVSAIRPGEGYVEVAVDFYEVHFRKKENWEIVKVFQVSP